MASTAYISGVSSSQAFNPAVPVITGPVSGSPTSAYGGDAKGATISEPKDIVTLMRKARQSRQQMSDKKESPSGMNNILFSYNYRGDLRIRFMDSTNSVVYQTPPLCFSRLSDLIASSRTTVSIRT